jgi:7-cyano-7-deazaguanine synthase
MKRRYGLRLITFVYHGIAEGEVRAARAIGRQVGAGEHRFVRLPDMKEAADLGVSFVGLPPTYIPMRNSVFYALAASYAEESGAACIAGGHNKDDLKIFRDAGPRFFREMEGALRAGSVVLARRRLRILRPLEGMTKPQVIRVAASLGVDFRSTWSCHEDGSAHCGKCGGCLGRADAFARARMADPLRVSPPGKVS